MGLSITRDTCVCTMLFVLLLHRLPSLPWQTAVQE